MKKKLISLIALVVVLGGAIAAYLWLSAPAEAPEDPSAPSAPAPETVYVLGGDPTPFVTEVRVKNGLDSYTVVNNHPNAIAMQNAAEPDFTIEGMPKEFLQQSMMKSLATYCANLDAKRALDGAAAEFGLDAPRATVEAVYDNGSATIEIGDEAPGGTGTYVRKDGAIYLVTSSKLTNMLLSRYGYVGTRITGGVSGADGQSMPTSFTKITLGGTKLPAPIVIEAPEEQNEEMASMGIASFEITAPIEAAADGGDTLTSLNSVFGLAAAEVVGLAEDEGALAAHGLDTPYLTTAVVTEDPEVGSFELQFSEADAEGTVYVRRLDRPFLYAVSKDMIPWYDYVLFDYMQKMLHLPFIDTVSSVEVIAGDAIYEFTVEGEGNEISVKLGDMELNVDYFKKFYQTLIAASIDSELEEDAAPPTGSPVLRYVYHYDDSANTDTVSFYSGPARRYFVRLNDGPVYYVKSLYVDAVFEDLDAVAAGEEVDAYL